jgi:hypothetical protein
MPTGNTSISLALSASNVPQIFPNFLYFVLTFAQKPTFNLLSNFWSYFFAFLSLLLSFGSPPCFLSCVALQSGWDNPRCCRRLPARRRSRPRWQPRQNERGANTLLTGSQRELKRRDSIEGPVVVRQKDVFRMQTRLTHTSSIVRNWISKTNLSIPCR